MVVPPCLSLLRVAEARCVSCVHVVMLLVHFVKNRAVFSEATGDA
jgi:hypothetical protein